MRRAVAIIAGLFFCATGVARAAEVHLGVSGETIYDDNVYSQAKNLVQDESFRITPSLHVIQDFPTVDLDLLYEPSFEAFVDQSSIDGFDHHASGSLHWEIGPSTDLSLSDDFHRFHSNTRLNEQVALLGQPLTFETVNQRNPFDWNTSGIHLRHLFSPRQMVQLDTGYSFWTYSNQNSRDFQVLSAGLSYTDALSKQVTAGGRLSWSRQHYDTFGTQAATQTDYYNLSPQLSLQIDPTLQFSVSAGPTLIVSQKPSPPPSVVNTNILASANTVKGRQLLDITTCPTLAGGTPIAFGCGTIDENLNTLDSFLGYRVEDLRHNIYLTGNVPSGGGNSVTVFANASLVKRWERWILTLSYQRQQDESSGLGVSSIVDNASAKLDWTPTPRFTASLLGGWIRRTQSQTQPIPVAGVSAAYPCNLKGDYFGFIVAARAVLSPAYCTALDSAAQTSSLRVTEYSSSVQVTQYYLYLRGAYRLTKRMRLFGRVWWSTRASTGTLAVAGTINHLVARVGVEYDFDPFLF